MDAGLIVAIVALLLGIANVVYTHRADQRAADAADLARRADERGERAEQREAEEAAESRRARPVVVARGGGGGQGAEVVSYSYELRNAGRAALTEYWLWHIDASSKESCSTRIGGQEVLMPGEFVKRGVEVRGPRPPRQKLMVSWRDDEGYHETETDIEPPPGW